MPAYSCIHLFNQVCDTNLKLNSIFMFSKIRIRISKNTFRPSPGPAQPLMQAASSLSIQKQLRKIIAMPSFLLLAISLTMLFSCSKSDTPAIKQSNQDTPGHISGMGSSTQPLQGASFNFPASVEIKGGIKGVSFGDNPAVLGYCQLVGSGAFVLLQMELVNHTGKDTVLVLPAGLTFKAADPKDQNGILIQDLPVALTKGSTCNTMVYVYCINQHRHGSSAESSYSFGPVTESRPIQELIDLLSHKKVNLGAGETSTLNGPIGDIQIWVWQLTDGEGLTPQDKAAIQALPAI